MKIIFAPFDPGAQNCSLTIKPSLSFQLFTHYFLSSQTHYLGNFLAEAWVTI